LFEKGRDLKDSYDELRICVPTLKAEQEWEKITQTNIEDEWFKLGEQFIRITGFKDLI